MILKNYNFKMNISGDNEYGNIFILYKILYIWYMYNIVVVYKFFCDLLLSILIKWNVYRRKKKFDNNLIELLFMSLWIFEDVCFKKWILMFINIYKIIVIKIFYLFIS